MYGRGEFLAKFMGKKRLIQRPAPDSTFVSPGNAAALCWPGMRYTWARWTLQAGANVTRMRIPWGAKVVPVTHGLKTLKKEAVGFNI